MGEREKFSAIVCHDFKTINKQFINNVAQILIRNVQLPNRLSPEAGF
jgi:hypothetical protein